MSYRLLAGLAKTQAEFDSHKHAWMPIVRTSLHDVLWMAMHVNDNGQQIAWEIEGDDGTRLGRYAIAAEITGRRRELEANPPKTY